MGQDPRQNTLFGPIRLGPVTEPNRFYQPPQCNGMGRNYPSLFVEMRTIKEEGGWRVVVTVVAPSFTVARFTEFTLEIVPIHKRLAQLGVKIVANHELSVIEEDRVQVRDIYAGVQTTILCAHVVMVAGCRPHSALLEALEEQRITSAPKLYAVGDALASGTITAAVYSGHTFAHHLCLQTEDRAPFLREDVAPNLGRTHL